MFDYKELRRIMSKYYKPGNSTDRLFYELKTGKSTSGIPRLDGKTRTRFHVAYVEDNQDPDKLGRIKVRFPQWGEEFISQWIPLIRPFSGPNMGFWALPEIDEKLLCVFIGDNTIRPMAMGSIFGPESGIPVDDVSDNNIRILTSRSGSNIIFDDTEGEEKLIISMKEGKMRMVLDKAKGVQIVNECGDIKIKCRKLTMKAGDTASIVTEKALNITTQKELAIESAKGANFKAAGDAIVKGQKIELKGNSGVTAQMKQIAAKDDQVVGVDTHIEMVPAGPSMVPTPIPNPYIGKLADKLSSDVEVKGKPAAVKGSKSKATPGHIPMPPGVQFQKAPSNEGEVTLGTVPTVLVNGKEVAVLGSMVKTCGDPMDMETCSIIAAGAAVYLPIVIPGLEYAFDSKMGGTQFNPRDPVANPAQPGQSKTPSLSSPQWSKTEALVGEEMTLEVTCNDQYDNANVFFCIWVDGEEKKPNTHVKKLVGNNKGGKAKAKWRYVYIHDPENPVTEKPKFVFTAISFRCEEVESGAVEFSDKVDVEVKDNILGEEVADREYKLIVEGTDITREGKVGSDKKILEEDLPPGKYQVRFIEEYEEEESFGDGTDDVGELDSSKEE